MSESKARLERENKDLKKRLDERTRQLVRLIDYIVELQRKYPAIDWPELPDKYREAIWRNTTV